MRQRRFYENGRGCFPSGAGDGGYWPGLWAAVSAVITNMDVPLGHCIGNGLEVAEAIAVLTGKGPDDLRNVCLELAAQMLLLAKKGNWEACLSMAKKALASGAAWGKFRQMCAAQGGDAAVLDQPQKLYEKAQVYELTAPQDGWVERMDAERCGRASMLLGAGRETKDSVIDPAAGIVLCRKTGEAVQKGQTLAWLYTGRISWSKRAGHCWKVMCFRQKSRLKSH